MNIKMTIAYDGSRFLGWQRLQGENKKRSIQSILECTLSNLLEEDIKIIGSGRTDAGVHALGQVANFHLSKSKVFEGDKERIERIQSSGGSPLDSFCLQIQKKMNQSLPEDIRIRKVELVEKGFHSRFDASWKTYCYRIDRRSVPQVFTRKYTYWYPEPLAISEMEKVAKAYLGKHDFSAFSTLRPDRKKKGNLQKDTFRTIFACDLIQKKEELWVCIQGDGFMYHMVRILVGTMLEVGQGKRMLPEVVEALQGGKRMETGILLPAQGLYLQEVGYAKGIKKK